MLINSFLGIQRAGTIMLPEYRATDKPALRDGS